MDFRFEANLVKVICFKMMRQPDKEEFNLTDTYRHKGMRRQLVGLLKKKGIRDQNILDAIEKIPRHFFLEKAFEEWAYEDKPFPIGEDQTISQPFTVAYQTELLEIKPREKVLEIGTGSGYQAAILAALGARVFTVERQEVLHHRSKKLLFALGLQNVRSYLRDGRKGLPEFAPFDKIIVTAGSADIPEALLKQLAIGGILIIPVGGDTQQMHKIIRLSENEYKDQTLDGFRFVPLLEGIVKK